MKRAQIEHGRWLQSMTEAVDPKYGPRPPVESRLMYSAKNHSGETLMCDGMVTNLSHHGLGMRVNAPVTPGIELMIFPTRRIRSVIRYGNQGGLDIRTSVRSRDPQDELPIRDRHRSRHHLFREPESPSKNDRK